ncbi:MAG: RAMP superfamily protein [Synechococcales cyanobacterium C42_A2020_086]|jgi:CRISPR-associated protein Cmr6|nr:RAMP superfamily protein [Synechococcales cyanobacterium C42_A2020_086]
MTSIPDAHQKVPMMFRAQVQGRSQLQYLDPQRKKESNLQDVELWADEWIDKAELIAAEDAEDIQTDTYGAKSYRISWRFVTNGGQDDGMIRPVIGARGIPFYPGSSMKGAFRQACQVLEAAGEVPQGTCDYYCGSETEVTPGALRFLGAYPTNDWTEGLLDLVHPQQGWQVKTVDTQAKPQGESAYAQVSLYQPTLRFAISSSKPLPSEQWQQIWQIWERAIASGLGSKVSTGYGQIKQTSYPIIYRVKLKGQGQASKLIDGTGEFRPSMFRAALRGHALRIFGGLTEADNAEQLVEDLFGGVRGRGEVGLLGLAFRVDKLEQKLFGNNGYEQPTYNVEGEITWLLTQSLSTEQTEVLQKLVSDLMWFAMVFGGFGKSWRRADHRLFYREENYEKLIGCHWQWAGEIDRRNALRVWKPTKVGEFIDSVRETAKVWMQLRRNINPNPDCHADWREAWHPSRVRIFGRIAKTRDDCAAIDWLHEPYQKKISNTDKEKTIKATSVTGQINRIGRLWHRMYPPKVRLVAKNSEKPKLEKTDRFLELLTIFPDGSQESNDFLEFLNTKPEGFEQLWGDK